MSNEIAIYEDELQVFDFDQDKNRPQINQKLSQVK
jgi:hypothetical protein